MKKMFVTAFVLILAGTVQAASKTKYVFYFIGDGMGISQINATEGYRAAREGKIGVKN